MTPITEMEWQIPTEEKGLSGETVPGMKYWNLPIESLPDDWRPRTAYIDYRFFEGPIIGPREHGLSLGQDLVAAVHGPRGATKTMTLTYLCGKKMRMGQPTWANYPISFYVIEPECIDNCKKIWGARPGEKICEFCKEDKKSLTYYENMPLDLDKFYRFAQSIRHGNVALTEFQYYVESRTSGKKQNRLASYQLMQIRKTALSFFYDVQNPDWVDKRFAWSDDTVIEVQDIALMNYDFDSVGHMLQRGERSQWDIEDRSGLLTGKRGQHFPPAEFYGWPFKDAYPTHFIIDAYDAMNSLHEEEAERADREDKVSKEVAALNLGINSFVEANEYEFTAANLSKRVEELVHVHIDSSRVGKLLRENGLEPTPRRNKMIYNVESQVQGGEGSLTGKDNE